ncbi:hypothetical protein HYS50_00320 [Candidatus Woesearchaeota archaeon]|nr:hypothetical protein [Candidatus Woesearchaeota archaeon]
MKIVSLALLLLTVGTMVVGASPEKKLLHAITISSMLITEQSLRCSKEVLVLVDLENDGSFTEDAYVELINKPLGVHAFSSPVQVRPRSREQVLIPLFFSEEPQGTYTFDAYLYTGRNIQEAFQPFTFAGCKTIKLTSSLSDLPVATLVQPSPSPEDEEPVDWLFMSTLFLVALLVIVASTAILRSF